MFGLCVKIIKRDNFEGTLVCHMVREMVFINRAIQFYYILGANGAIRIYMA
jgi:hypothetical protein